MIEVCAGCGAISMQGDSSWLRATVVGRSFEAQPIPCCSPECAAIFLTEKLPPVLMLHLLDGEASKAAAPQRSFTASGSYVLFSGRLSTSSVGLTLGASKKRCMHCGTIARPILGFAVGRFASDPVAYVDSPTCLLEMREYVLSIARAAGA